MLYKLRKITKSSRQEVWGFTVPDEVRIRFQECKFKCAISGTTITFYSGCLDKPTEEELLNYNYEDCQ